MNNLPDLIIYIAIIVWGTYGILIAPYYGAKIMMKTGKSERFWFFIFVILNLWAFLIVLIRPKFRKELKGFEIIKLVLLACGYPALFFPLLAILS